MKCHSCPDGQTGPGTKTATLERGETTIVVRHAPAEVCDTCGAELYDAATTDRLLQLLDRAVAQKVRVQVQDFTMVDHGESEEPARSRVGATRR